MDKATLSNGIDLEFETQGTGEPVLLIPNGPIADCFLPFVSEPALVDQFRLVRYHQRGQAGSSRNGSPAGFRQHAADAAHLLQHLGIERAHVAGHSTGANVALQLAHDYPAKVHTLALLEPPLTTVPSAPAFFKAVEPAVGAYTYGDYSGAMTSFLSAAGGLPWEVCQEILDRYIPGGVALAIKDADNFFGRILPALSEWQFGSKQAATISRPVLSVLGTATGPLFADGHTMLQSWFPEMETYALEGTGHFLQMQSPAPVAQRLAEFFTRHPITEV